MANFNNATFRRDEDDWMTPKSAWRDIAHLIPRDKVIWEAFYGDGVSAKHLRELGFRHVVHEPIDFFTSNRGDIVVSNPPFSKIPEILERLLELDKPFVLIMPASKLNTQYFRRSFLGKRIQIVIPRKRIHFVRKNQAKRTSCNFDCFYYCYKIGLERDIVWLD